MEWWSGELEVIQICLGGLVVRWFPTPASAVMSSVSHDSCVRVLDQVMNSRPVLPTAELEGQKRVAHHLGLIVRPQMATLQSFSFRCTRGFSHRNRVPSSHASELPYQRSSLISVGLNAPCLCGP